MSIKEMIKYGMKIDMVVNRNSLSMKINVSKNLIKNRTVINNMEKVSNGIINTITQVMILY